MKKEKATFIEWLCFILLITVATLLIFTKILPEFGVKFDGKFWSKTLSVLGQIQNIALISLACVGAFVFTQKNSKVWLIMYIVAVVICVFSIIVPIF